MKLFLALCGRVCRAVQEVVKATNKVVLELECVCEKDSERERESERERKGSTMVSRPLKCQEPHTILSATTASEVARFCTMTAAMAMSRELKDWASSVASSRAPGCSSSASWREKHFSHCSLLHTPLFHIATANLGVLVAICMYD